MSDKKRKKSYTVRMKRERAVNEQQVKAKKKKEIILMSVICVLIFALAFGIVFGGIAIYNSFKKYDYSAYAEEYEKSDFNKTYTAKISIKDYGTVTVLLVRDAAPKTVNKFITRARDGFYNGLAIDNVQSDVMIKGGYKDEAEKLEGELDGSVKLEHIRGVFSMVSVDDDNSTASQFLICTETNKKTEAFDGVHTAIGYVTSGLKIIDKIMEDTEAYTNASGSITDVTKQLVIESIEIIDFAQEGNELPGDIIG